MREPEKWSLWEVEQKRDWEGDWFSLYFWGGPDAFTTDDEHFNRLWFEFSDHMNMLRPIMDEMSEIVRKADAPEDID